MPERKYSIAEIDRMRSLIRRQFPSDVWESGMNFSAPRLISLDYSATVEDQLRTYMINGTEPDELEALPRAIKMSGFYSQQQEE